MSSQSRSVGTWSQLLAASSHLSTVQATPSSQLGVAEAHRPALQTSAPSHHTPLSQSAFVLHTIIEPPVPPVPLIEPPVPLIEPPVPLIEPPVPLIEPPVPLIEPPVPLIEPPVPSVDPSGPDPQPAKRPKTIAIPRASAFFRTIPPSGMEVRR